MRRSPETSINAALGATLTAVLGLCALTISPVASAGVTSLCDTRTIDPPDLDIHAGEMTGELTIELIDLGRLAPVDLDVTIDADAMTLPAPPDVDAMLKRMFQLSDNFESPAVHAQSPVQRFPVADLSTPAIETEVSMSGTDASENEAETDIGPPAVSTRIPGLSEDDLRRYRRKMYRTDI